MGINDGNTLNGKNIQDVPSDQATYTPRNTFDAYKEDYKKSVGSIGGKDAADSKKYSSTIDKDVEQSRNLSFFKKGKLELGKLKDGLSDLMDTDKLSPSKLTDLIKGNKLKDGTLGGDQKTINKTLNKLKALDATGNILDKVTGPVLNKLKSALLSRVHIPDLVYLSVLVSLDLAGADIEHNDDYIYKMMLRRDITVGLKWYNKIWKLEYSGLSYDSKTAEIFTAARYGAHKNVEYMLEEFWKSYNDIRGNVNGVPEGDIKSDMLNNMEDIYSNMVRAVRMIIVYGYTSFRAKNLEKILKNYNMEPSFFGENDTRFNCRHRITDSDIDILAPYYTYTKGGLMDGIAKMSENRSSRYRRTLKKNKSKRDVPLNLRELFIKPRNNNIKRLYIILTDSKYGTVMYNEELYNRLKCKIATTAIELLDENLGGLVPWAVLAAREALWTSAYDYTKSVEDFLYDPAKIEYIKIADTDVIHLPKDADPNKNNVVLKEEKKVSLGNQLVVTDMNSTNNTIKDVPNNIDDYIQKAMELFLKINVESILNTIITKLENGTITIPNNTTMQAIIFQEWKTINNITNIFTVDPNTINPNNNGILNNQLNTLLSMLNNKMLELDGKLITFNNMFSTDKFQDMINKATDLVEKGTILVDKTDKFMLEALDTINDLYDKIVDGKLLLKDMKTLEQLVIEAKDSIKKLSDLSTIIKELKDMGVDIDNIDINDLQDTIELQEILENQDIDSFDFDIDNPPFEVIKDINDEINGPDHILYYRWRNY